MYSLLPQNVSHVLNSRQIMPIIAVLQEYQRRYEDEQKLNQELNTFSRNFNLLYRGKNECEEQLGYNGSRRKNCVLRLFNAVSIGMRFVRIEFSLKGRPTIFNREANFSLRQSFWNIYRIQRRRCCSLAAWTGFSGLRSHIYKCEVKEGQIL